MDDIPVLTTTKYLNDNFLRFLKDLHKTQFS